MINRVKDPFALREIERLRAENERQKAIIDYIAMMTDIEIPNDSDGEDDEQIR